MSFDLVIKYMLVTVFDIFSAYPKGVTASQCQFYFGWNKILGEKINQPELEDMHLNSNIGTVLAMEILIEFTSKLSLLNI